MKEENVTKQETVWFIYVRSMMEIIAARILVKELNRLISRCEGNEWKNLHCKRVIGEICLHSIFGFHMNLLFFPFFLPGHLHGPDMW